ncbi:MAG TPA: hypothetical protein VFF52_09035 [Isosphaeraceae bacterium]|nr:hypothetical protein [Isosphaeraceae bacterium]
MGRIRPNFGRGVAGLALSVGLAVVVAGLAPSSARLGEAGKTEAVATQPSSDAPGAVDPKPSGLVVHEWGTFLGMNGSDGAALDGMYHEEHALPSFVHARSRDQLRLPIMFLKGETPVIYFYTPQPVQVRVGVGFPHGIWTQWYPQAAVVRPSLVEQAESPDRLRGGRICWFADVIPASAVPKEIPRNPGGLLQRAFDLPATSRDALWNFARDVDAAFVRTIDRTQPAGPAEYERFLFYRGLGQARLPLRAEARSGGTLALDRDPTLGDGVRHIFVLRVEDGRGAYQYRPALRPGEEVTGLIPPRDKALPLAQFTRAVADDLAARLIESGLYPKEARAMVNTWTNSYFQSEGIRILFVLPQSWTDTFIPISIVPQPKQVVRVMVGRLELLSPERERLAEAAVRDLAGTDSARRQRAFGYLREQGRYVEPIVRRIARTTRDDQVRTLCRRLLLTEFVTELRATIHHAGDGKRLNTEVIQLRAHLARVLREIGLAAEARAESVALWQELRKSPEPPGRSEAGDPGALELRGAYLEAIGDDGRAAETYARRVESYVRSVKPGVSPDALAWTRDWWVGRAYAQCLVRAGKADATIAQLEETLSRSNPVACSQGTTGERTARVLLALLLDAQDRRDRASSLVLRP